MRVSAAPEVIDLRSKASSDLPTRAEDLEPGLLVFFARPSLLQTWAELCGHEWRHVGITVQTPDGLQVASYGPRKCYRLDDPVAILSAYDRVGVARIFHDDDEVFRCEQFCRTYSHLERSDAPYTFSGILVGPIHLMARRCRPGPLRSVLFAFVYLYCLLQQLRYNDRGAFGCSTFVWAVIDAVRLEPFRMPLSAHPDDEAAYATVPTDRDALFARWLCGPTELWQAIGAANRGELDLAPSEARRDSELEASELQNRHCRLDHVSPREFESPAA